MNKLTDTSTIVRISTIDQSLERRMDSIGESTSLLFCSVVIFANQSCTLLSHGVR